MIQRIPRPSVALGRRRARAGVVPSAACRKKEAPAPPMATPSVTLNHDKTPLGSPIDITYKFVVASDAKFTEDYRVMVHVVDADEELMWTDDHNPPMPTTQWKPGQTVEYTRTVFVPIYPYVGEATIQVGLYSTTTQKRAAAGGRGRRAARLQGREAAAAAADRERLHGLQGRLAPGRNRRAQRHGRVAVDEEGRDARVQEPEEGLRASTSTSTTRAASSRAAAGHGDAGRADVSTDSRSQPEAAAMLRKIPLTAAAAGQRRHGGAADRGRQDVRAGRARRPRSKDPRELGVRVFHAYVDPQIDALDEHCDACVAASSCVCVLCWPPRRRARSSSFSRPAARMSVKGHRVDGDSLVLTLRGGGEIVCDAVDRVADRARRSAVSRARGRGAPALPVPVGGGRRAVQRRSSIASRPSRTCRSSWCAR